MIISTQSLKPIEWIEQDFEFIGIINKTIRVCVVTPEYQQTEWKTLDLGAIRTGRWIIRYSMQNENGKPFGEYADSAQEAKDKANKFLRGFIEHIVKGAHCEN